MARLSAARKISLVNMLGGLMLACAAGYFVSLGRALLTQNEQWRDFFFSNVLWFLYIPFTLGLVYFFARVQLGRSLLKDGALHEALTWCEPRLHYSFWLRGKREVLIQRLVVAQVHVRQLNMSAAKDVLWMSEPLPDRAKELIELHLWRAIWALRQEDLIVAKQACEEGRAFEKPPEHRAALLAVDAMRVLRTRDFNAVQRLLEESRWLAKVWQATWCEILLEAEHDSHDSTCRSTLLEQIADVELSLREHVPGALPEFLLASATVAARESRPEQAAELASRAQGCDADARSAWVLSQSTHHHEEE